jgi:hypothetical protein
LPLSTATLVSSWWRASISMRLVIDRSPGASPAVSQPAGGAIVYGGTARSSCEEGPAACARAMGNAEEGRERPAARRRIMRVGSL